MKKNIFNDEPEPGCGFAAILFLLIWVIGIPVIGSLNTNALVATIEWLILLGTVPAIGYWIWSRIYGKKK